MQDASEIAKLQYGQVIYASGSVPTLDCYALFYFIFIGFTSFNTKSEYNINKIKSEMEYSNKGKDYDIYNAIDKINGNMILVPLYMSVVGESSKKELELSVKRLFSKPTPLYRTSYAFKHIVSAYSLTDFKVPKQDLDAYMLKCTLTNTQDNIKLKDLWSTNDYYKEIDKIYGSANVLTSMKQIQTVKTKEYKPRHFYLFKGNKTTRLYYCLARTEKSDESIFVLLYNTKSKSFTAFDEREILNILNQGLLGNIYLVSSLENISLSLKADKELYEIVGIEAERQQLGYYQARKLRKLPQFSYSVVKQDVIL